MRLVALIVLILSIPLGAGVWSMRPAHAAASQNQPVFLDVGDSFQIAGAPVGCKVIARSGGKSLDCRIAGRLRGSYGTLMSATRLNVVRFTSSQVAKVVFTATQHGSFRVCR
jgi:hypothetical protein